MVLSLMCQVHPTDPSWGNMASLSLSGCWWVTAAPSQVRTELVSRRPQELSFPQVRRCPLYESDQMSAHSIHEAILSLGEVGSVYSNNLSYPTWADPTPWERMKRRLCYQLLKLARNNFRGYSSKWLTHSASSLPCYPPPIPMNSSTFPTHPFYRCLTVGSGFFFFCPSSLTRALSVTIELKQSTWVLRVWGEWAHNQRLWLPLSLILSVRK